MVCAWFGTRSAACMRYPVRSKDFQQLTFFLAFARGWQDGDINSLSSVCFWYLCFTVLAVCVLLVLLRGPSVSLWTLCIFLHVQGRWWSVLGMGRGALTAVHYGILRAVCELREHC